MAKKKKGKRKTQASAGSGEAGNARAGSTRTQRRQQRQKRQQRTRIYQIAGAVAIVAAIAAVALWPRPRAAPVDAARLALEPAIGPESAVVTIIEYADFGCPACRAWHDSGIRERVIANYGDRVRFEWRDFPVITPYSPKAAEAGQCALDQGQDQFWAFHDQAYAFGDIRIPALKSYAQQVGLDTAEFNACLDSGRHRATVENDLNQARSSRLRGTPSFVINGRVLPGPPQYAQLASIIEAALASN